MRSRTNHAVSRSCWGMSRISAMQQPGGVPLQVRGNQCLVAGNLSLTWMYEPGSPSAADRVRKTFDEQLAVQVDDGIDFIIGETFSWVGEALIAVERAKRTGLPAMVTICFENKDETAEGMNRSEERRVG